MLAGNLNFDENPTNNFVDPYSNTPNIRPRARASFDLGIQFNYNQHNDMQKNVNSNIANNDYADDPFL